MNETGLNSYQVLESIHRSRRFSLYRASKLDTGLKVLIKTPDSIRSKDENLIKALMAEAEAARQLSHPAIRACYDSQDEPGAAFFIGEYIPGESLARFQTKDGEAIPFPTVINWVCELLEALEYAHSRGIYHQNLNPYHVLVDNDMHLRVIGFGKSKNAWLNGEDGYMPWHPILFVAPETFQAGQVHPTSDLFSWAVITYSLLCQALPWRIDEMLSFEKQKQQSLCRAVIMPDILKKEVPDWLFSLLLSCLKLDPNQRPASAREILDVIKSETNVSAEPEAATPPPEEDIPADLISTEPEPTIDEPLPAAEPESVQTDLDLPSEETAPASEPDLPPETAAEQPEEAFTLRILDEEPPTPAAIPTVPEPEPEPEPESALEPEFESEEEPFAAVYQELTREDNPPALLAEIPIAVQEEVPPTPIAPAMEPPIPQPEPASTIEAAPTPLSAEPETTAPTATLREQEAPAPLSPSTPKPRQSTPPLYQADPFKRRQQPTHVDDTPSLKKTFRLLGWMTLAIIGFIVVKYVVFARRPDFSHLQKEEIPLEEESSSTLANAPIKMIAVPADTLVMGNTAPGAANDEFPLLTLRVNKFYMSVCEITQQEWQMIYPDSPSADKNNDLPVENVTFYDAVEFCNAKSLKDGFQPCYDFVGNEVSCNFEADGYRLPTEAEWEFAAKAGKRYQFSLYSGSDDPNEVAWYNANSDAHSHPGARKKANPLGLYDLSGNLYEWVWNWYAPYSYRYPDPAKGPLDGTDKVLRGGSWYHDLSSVRVTARFHAKPFSKSNYIGFRVVRSALE